jgi:adenylosuccinate synthase
LPSGILNSDKTVVISNGTVVNPEVLLEEISTVKKRKKDIAKLYISDRAHVLLPYHPMMDGVEEKLKGEKAIGTTKKGIGPCYSDKINRYGIRFCDLLNKDSLKEKIEFLYKIKKHTLESFGEKLNITEKELYEKCLNYGKEFKNNIADTSVIISDALESGKSVLFEGAHGTMLCIDHGTFPYVTSSNTVAGSVCSAAGIGPQNINKVIGIVKAYTSRVGEGPFVTELGTYQEAKQENKEEGLTPSDLKLMDKSEYLIGKYIRKKGHEYGTTTGRPRRCGWLDIVLLKHSKRVNGLTEIAITRLDILTGLKKLKICVKYKLDGKTLDNFPADVNLLGKCKPVYIELNGWNEDISKKRDYESLPDNCKKYLEKIEELLKTKIRIISVGPDREETIIRKI